LKKLVLKDSNMPKSLTWNNLDLSHLKKFEIVDLRRCCNRFLIKLGSRGVITIFIPKKYIDHYQKWIKVSIYDHKLKI
jgi:hypothetical protein